MDNHATQICRKPSVCSVPGCGQKHTKFIHVDVARSAYDKSNVYLPVVSVKVNDRCTKLALLDNASTKSFCSGRLCKELNIKGTDVNYSLGTLSKSEENKSSQAVDLCLKSQDKKQSLTLSDVYVVDDIPVGICNVDVSQFDHLYALPLIHAISEVDIVIGQDNAEALVPVQTIRGKKGEPYAVLTMFGWTVNGPVRSGEQSDHEASGELRDG